MAENSFATLQAILIAKLTALQGSGAEELFAQVASSNITDPDGYPLCYVVMRKGDGTLVDTHRNQRGWEFSVVIHYALANKTEEEASALLQDAVDRVTTMFDRDPQLVDTDTGFAQCKRVEVTPVLIERVNQDVAVIRALLNVRVIDLVQRYA